MDNQFRLTTVVFPFDELPKCGHTLNLISRLIFHVLVYTYKNYIHKIRQKSTVKANHKTLFFAFT